MIFVDACLLLYADDAGSPFHNKARDWWESTLSGIEEVGIPWQSIQAYMRIGTSIRLMTNPLSPLEACDRVQTWLDQPIVFIPSPTSNHWKIFSQLVKSTHISGNLLMDASVATLAMEHGAVLYSADSDFARFPGLKWRNPLLA